MVRNIGNLGGGGRICLNKTMKYIGLFIALVQCCFASGAIDEARDNIKRVMIQADWIAHVVYVSNATEYDTQHKDARFDETKLGIIAGAISDAFTNSGAFKGKKKGDFITFDGTDISKYSAANFNALYLWNWLFVYRFEPNINIDDTIEYTTKLLKEQYKDIEDIEAKIDKAEHDFKYYDKELGISSFLYDRTKILGNALEYNINIDDFYINEFTNHESTSYHKYEYEQRWGDNVGEVTIKITDWISKESTNKENTEWVIYKTELQSKPIDYIFRSDGECAQIDFKVVPINDKFSIYSDIIFGTGDYVFSKIADKKYDWERLYNDILSASDDDYAYIYKKLKENPGLNCEDKEQFRQNIIDILHEYYRQCSEPDDNNVEHSEEEHVEISDNENEGNENEDSEGGD